MCRFNNRLTLVSVMVLSLTALSVSVTHAEGPKAILVYIDQQRLFAFEDYKLIHEFDVVTGRPGKETMSGKFKITRKPTHGGFHCGSGMAEGSRTCPAHASGRMCLTLDVATA